MRTAAICPTCATYENAICVIYDGPGLIHIDVAPLDDVSTALEKIDTAIGVLQASSGGTAGTSGTSGISGTSGTNGSTGLSGSSGTSGLDGGTGSAGSNGTSGTDGTSGTSGGSGISGLTTNRITKATSATTIGNSLLFDNGSSVGIGNTSPSRTLDITGSLRSTGILTVGRNEGGAGNSYFDINAPQSTFAPISLSGVDVTSLTGKELSINPTFYTPSPVEGGNVGINLTQANPFPLYKLDVNGTGRFNLSTYFATTSGVVGIGTTVLDASAKVQIDSITQGFLPPRMTASQRTAIVSPAVGLMVYQTDATEGLYIYKSTGWTFIV